jgi:predicted ATPase
MEYLWIHSGVVSQELGNLGHVLGIFDEAVPIPMDLTQVGVGVSQVLPVLVQALLTPPGGTLLLEQPELHLHPAVQSRLADFLVAACCDDRQILCETHSEYLVTRLRILTAERTEMRDGFLRIYFVARLGANTQFEEVKLDDRGRIANWPRGFFDQSSLDAARILEMDLAL